ncbi:MAG TPA: Ada metal-binding domain-containing protein [Verrucomicrobiae bacterium]|nr:Ada metal-binding domain-containing protein [Verrucomicrobiae bacterium]
MNFSQESYYKAVLAHDRRFDGQFFICVSSTGIYCRPVCSAQVPKIENCSFVATPAAAEKAGFRPCLRCRPERAPGTTPTLPSAAQQLAAHIDDTLLMQQTLADASRSFAMSPRHVRRLFAQEFGVEPKDYLTTKRLLFAKQLLQDTNLPIAQVAYAAGFATPGRLTINMRQSYGFTPRQLRKNRQDLPDQAVSLRTDYRPPFDWQNLLSFLRGRATPFERVLGDTYIRTINNYEIKVQNVAHKNQLLIEIPAALAGQSYRIVRRVRKLFDLDANPLVIAASLAEDPQLKKLIEQYPGLRVPGCWDNFEMLLRVILGQQVSVAGATTLMNRLASNIGTRPAQIAASTPEAIAQIGVPLKRATTIWQVGCMVQDGSLRLDEPNPVRFYERLVAIPGIGPWTAEYLQMRLLHWPDVLPAGDLGLQKAVQPGSRFTERQLRERAKKWQPWRSYATVLLWKSLDNQGG